MFSMTNSGMIGMIVKIDGVAVAHLTNNSNSYFSPAFSSNHSMNQSIFGVFPSIITKGSVITVYMHTMAVFSPICTLYERNCKITGKIRNIN